MLKEGITCNEALPGNIADGASTSRFSNDGGFLQHPVFDSIANNFEGHLFDVDSSTWERFGCSLSAVAWPSILRCLADGKAFIDLKMSQVLQAFAILTCSTLAFNSCYCPINASLCCYHLF